MDSYEYGSSKASWADKIQWWRGRNAIGKRCKLCGKLMWVWQGYYKSSAASPYYTHPKCNEAETGRLRGNERRERFEKSIRERQAQ